MHDIPNLNLYMMNKHQKDFKRTPIQKSKLTKDQQQHKK